MKETHRGILYAYCIEYIKTITLRQELFYNDDEYQCQKLKSKLDDELATIEKMMKEILAEKEE